MLDLVDGTNRLVESYLTKQRIKNALVDYVPTVGMCAFCFIWERRPYRPSFDVQTTNRDRHWHRYFFDHTKHFPFFSRLSSNIDSKFIGLRMSQVVQLLKAVRKEDEPGVRKILQTASGEERRKLLNSLSKKGECLPHTAIQISTSEVVDAILEQAELDVDIYDGEYGYTLLIAAIAFGAEVSVVRKLLSRNPDLTLRDKTEAANTAFHWGAALNNIAALDELLKAKKHLRDILNGSGETPLHVAIRADQDEAAALLIEMGADVNAKDADWETPLHAATAGRLPNVANMIVQSGRVTVDEHCDKEGNTPLHIACRMQQERVSDLLRTVGFSDKAVNHLGECPADYDANTTGEGKEELMRQREDAKKSKSLRRREERQADMENTEVSLFLKKYGCGRGSIEFLYGKRYHLLDSDFWSLTDSKLMRMGMRDGDHRGDVTKALSAYEAEQLAKEREEEEKLLRAVQQEQRRRLYTLLGAISVVLVSLILLVWSGVLDKLLGAIINK